MKKLGISAYGIALCFLISACGGHQTADIAKLKTIDPARYNGDEIEIAQIESPQTLAEALAEVNDHREDVQSLSSYRMTDYGKKFWIGDGYDALNGMRAPTCFDPKELQIQVRPIKETSDTFDVVYSYVDLYKKLETEFGADLGGAWEIFTGKASFKTNIMRETKINSDDVVVLAGFSYVKDQIALYNSWPTYAKFFHSLSVKNKGLFRKYCGDRYTKDVSVGAGMYMVFTAKKTDDTQLDKNAVESAISVGLAAFFSVGANGKVSDEQKRILQHYTFSAKCYSAGTTADVCGSYSLSTVLDVLNDTKAIQDRIREARQKIVEDVNTGENLVAVKETLVDYDVPFESCTFEGDEPCPSRWTYFSDYRPRLSKARELSLLKSFVEESCFKADYWKRRCLAAEQELSRAILACMTTSEECRDPDRTQIDIVMSSKNPGRIAMWTDAWSKGAFYEVDFDQSLGDRAKKPNTFYDFYAIGWGKGNDKITSIDILLHPAWGVTFHEHLEPWNSGAHWDFQGRRYIGNIGAEFGGANDKISAFELVPIPDL